MAKNYTIIKSYKIQQVDSGSRKYSLRELQGVLNIGGHDFVPLNWRSGPFANCFLHGASEGYDAEKSVTASWPRAVLVCLKDARNKAIDQIMTDHLRASDPMSESITLPDNQASRSKLFHESKVPPILTITMDSFVTDNGEVIESCDLKITSHPKTHGLVCLELSCSSMRWLACMCARTYADGSADDHMKEEQDTIDMIKTWLPHPVKLVPNNNKKGTYYLRVRINGKTTVHAVVIEKGVPSIELKDYIDEQVHDILKRVDKKQAAASSYAEASDDE